MPTVIDSLVVQLGLDPKDFKAGIKSISEGFDVTRKGAEKSGKDIEGAFKRGSEALIDIRNQALAVAGVFTAGLGIKEFTAQTIRADAAAGRLANNIGMSVSTLGRWEVAARLAGGTAEGVDNAFQGISASINKLKLTGVTDQSLADIMRFVNLNDAAGNLRPLADVMTDISAALASLPPGEAIEAGKRFGFDENTTNFLKQGAGALKDYLAEAEKVGHVNENNSAAAIQLSSDWEKLTLSSQTLGRTILTDLAPALHSILGAGSDALQKISKEHGANPISKGWDWELGLLTGDKDFSLGGELFDMLRIKPPDDIGAGNPKASSQPSVGSSAPTAAPGTDKNLPRSLRNNNPGNMEYTAYSKSLGATGSDGRFAIFPTMAMGQAAATANIGRLAGKGDDTISKLIGAWSPAKENGSANTNSYIAEVARKSGINPNAHIDPSQYGAIEMAMFGHEANGSKYASQILAGLNGSSGSSSGKSTNEVNIGTINVNTNAQNAAGIVKDMKNQITSQGLVSQANGGLQ